MYETYNMGHIQETVTIFLVLFEGLLAEQCFNYKGGYYANLYSNTQYCAFGCCGQYGNVTCCSIVAPVLGIVFGIIAFIVILIILICCCRKFGPSLKEIRRKPEKLPGPTLASLPDSSIALSRHNSTKSKNRDVERYYSSDDSRISDHPKHHHVVEHRENPHRKSDQQRYERQRSFDSEEDYHSYDSGEKRQNRRKNYSENIEREYDSDYSDRRKHSNSRRHREHYSRRDSSSSRRNYEDRPRHHREENRHHDSRRSTSSYHKHSQHSGPPPYRDRY